MKYLKGILSESDAYYAEIEGKIRKRILKLPRGSIKKRRIGMKIYWYLQKRDKRKVVHKYVGKVRPINLIRQITERKKLQKELKNILENRKIIKSSRVKRNGKTHK